MTLPPRGAGRSSVSALGVECAHQGAVLTLHSLPKQALSQFTRLELWGYRRKSRPRVKAAGSSRGAVPSAHALLWPLATCSKAPSRPPLLDVH